MSSLEKAINILVEGFIRDIGRVAEAMPVMAVSEIHSLNDAMKIRDIKNLVNACEDVYSTYIEVYIALEQELNEPVQDLEKKRLTQIAFNLRKEELEGYISIINVKAQFYLKRLKVPLEQSLKERLVKMSKITAEDMKKAWHDEAKTLL